MREFANSLRNKKVYSAWKLHISLHLLKKLHLLCSIGYLHQLIYLQALIKYICRKESWVLCERLDQNLVKRLRCLICSFHVTLQCLKGLYWNCIFVVPFFILLLHLVFRRVGESNKVRFKPITDNYYRLMETNKNGMLILREL